MEYLKRGSHILIGNSGIPRDLKSEYFATLCAEVESLDKKHKFVDISLSRKQAEMLRDLLVHQLNTALFVELLALMRVALDKAYRWERENHKTPSEVEFKSYRDKCFHEIWDSFWETAKGVKTFDLIQYQDPQTTYEERMQAYLIAHDWWIDSK